MEGEGGRGISGWEGRGGRGRAKGGTWESSEERKEWVVKRRVVRVVFMMRVGMSGRTRDQGY